MSSYVTVCYRHVARGCFGGVITFPLALFKTKIYYVAFIIYMQDLKKWILYI